MLAIPGLSRPASWGSVGPEMWTVLHERQAPASIGRLLQNPVDVFLQESKCVPRARRAAFITPGYACHSNEFLPSRHDGDCDFGILPQWGLAGAEKRPSTEVLGSTQFLKRFSADTGSSQVHRHSKNDTHFTSPFGHRCF